VAAQFAGLRKRLGLAAARAQPLLEKLAAHAAPLTDKARPHVQRAGLEAQKLVGLLREDVAEIRRGLRSLDNRPVLEWAKRQSQVPRTRVALARLVCSGLLMVLAAVCLFNLLATGSGVFTKRKLRRRVAVPVHRRTLTHDSPGPRWRTTPRAGATLGTWRTSN
jgi:hypothetical protein